MGETKTLSFHINYDVSEKFEVALLLNKEKADEVIEKMLIQYIAGSFSKASKAFSVQQPVRSNYLSEKDENFAKAKRKIPTWARKPQQNNHKIIRAFFEIEEEMSAVTVDALAKRCSILEEFPNTFTSDFKGNFAQMKTDAGNSHGKVFVVNDNIVEVWSEVEDILIENKHLFMGGFNVDSKKIKINDEMVAVAYDIAKKVYQREIGRNDGKIEITRLSGMSPGSAQDYITAFLDMMEGKEYHRTMSNFSTSYFLDNIKKDFGEDAFLLALEATEKHIKYYNALGYGQLKAKEDIVTKLKESRPS